MKGVRRDHCTGNGGGSTTIVARAPAPNGRNLETERAIDRIYLLEVTEQAVAIVRACDKRSVRRLPPSADLRIQAGDDEVRGVDTAVVAQSIDEFVAWRRAKRAHDVHRVNVGSHDGVI